MKIVLGIVAVWFTLSAITAFFFARLMRHVHTNELLAEAEWITREAAMKS